MPSPTLEAASAVGGASARATRSRVSRNVLDSEPDLPRTGPGSGLNPSRLCAGRHVFHRSGNAPQFSQFSQFPTWLSCFGLTRELNEWIVASYGNKCELWRPLVVTFGRTRFPCQKPPEEPLENGALRNLWTVFSSKDVLKFSGA